MNSNTFFIEEINNLAKNDKDLLISMGEEMYHDQIDTLAKDIIDKKANVILVAGPSSSGKTTTSNLIGKRLEKYGLKCLSVSLDDFFLNRADTPLLPNGNYDFENITALDLNGFNKFIDELYTQGHSLMPTYNFVTGEREKELTKVSIDDNTVVIIEGLHALNPTLINKKDGVYRVYICPTSNFEYNNEMLFNYVQLRLLRRMLRDYLSRGRTIEKTIEGWQEVLDGEKKYIDPYKHLSNFVVDSTHMYEPLIYSKYLTPLLKNTKIEKEIKEKLKKITKLDKKYIPKDSLLNEFAK